MTLNPRKLTLLYLGWCPGVENMASWIPDKEYSNKHVFRLSMLTFLAILFFPFIHLTGNHRVTLGI